jgi:hypothetical protein
MSLSVFECCRNQAAIDLPIIHLATGTGLIILISIFIILNVAIAAIQFLVPVHAADDFMKECLSFNPEVHSYNSIRQIFGYVPSEKDLPSRTTTLPVLV